MRSIVQTREEFDDFIEHLTGQPEVTLDVETSGLDVWLDDRICGIGFDFKGTDQYYLPFRHKYVPIQAGLFSEPKEYDWENLPIDWMQEIWPVLQKVPIIVGHHIKFDLAALNKEGYVVPVGPDMPQLIEDTKSCARLAFHDQHANLDLETCTKELLNVPADEWKKELAAHMARQRVGDHYDWVEIDVLGDYCMNDVMHTSLIKKKMQHYVYTETLQGRVYEREREVVTVLWDVEKNGMKIDLDYINQAIAECEAAMKVIISEIEEISDQPLGGFNKAIQITRIFDAVGQLPIEFTAKKKNPSWSETALTRVAKNKKNLKAAKIANLMLSGRSIEGMVTKFFSKYAKFVDGYVHPSFNPYGTITGRFSCNDPNLQQVMKPVKWDIYCCPDFDVQVRRMFIAPEGYKLVCIDYRQMEMIGFADYLRDPVLTEELNKGETDYHTMVGNMIFEKVGIELDRKDSKPISLGLIYGMGKDKFAARLEKSVEEAQMLKKAFFKAFPTAEKTINQMYNAVRDNTFVTNKFDRRYYIPEEHIYAVVNYLVQGSCADLIKTKMVEMFKYFLANELKSRIVFQMHDEFGFYIKHEEWEVLKAIITILEDVFEYVTIKGKQAFNTKFFVDVSLAEPSWADKKAVCKTCLGIKEDSCTCYPKE